MHPIEAALADCTNRNVALARLSLGSVICSDDKRLLIKRLARDPLRGLYVLHDAKAHDSVPDDVLEHIALDLIKMAWTDECQLPGRLQGIVTLVGIWRHQGWFVTCVDWLDLDDRSGSDCDSDDI